MKEGMPRQEAKQEKRESYEVPQELIDGAFEPLARVYWTDLPEPADAEERIDRLTKAVAAQLIGVDPSQIKRHPDYSYYFGKGRWDTGTVVAHLDEIEADTQDGTVRMDTLVAYLDHTQQEQRKKKEYLKLKVTPERFEALRKKADEAEHERINRSDKEHAHWNERMNKAKPAFLAFAKMHQRRKLTQDESEAIRPMIEAVRRGEALRPDEQISLQRVENGAWQFLFYRNGQLADIFEYRLEDPKEVEEAEQREDIDWSSRIKEATPEFLAFAKTHEDKKLSSKESEAIHPMIEAIHRGEKMKPNEQIVLKRVENGAWQFHFYRDGELYDVHEYILQAQK